MILFSMLAGALTASPPVRVLIVTGSSDEPFHRWRETTAAIRDGLNAVGGFEVNTTEEPRGLSVEALAGYEVILLNYNGPRFPKSVEAALENFVSSGKGLVAFHQASYGTFFGMEYRNGHWVAGPAGSGWAAFPRIIGAEWAPADIGHARRAVFQVDWKDARQPFMANDELYHKLKLDPSVQVLADAMSPTAIGGTGKREPLIWTNRFGKGRVFFTTLGHDTEAWYQSSFMEAFVHGVEWAAKGEWSSGTTHRADPLRMLVVTGGHTYPTAFYTMLNSLGVAWTHATNPEEAFKQPLENRYDVLLLHDMGETTSANTRARLQAFVDAGKGVVAIHHAIVDYTDWPFWYEQVIGGKYFTKAVEGHAASQYHEGVEYEVSPARGKAGHPILKGVGPLWVHDEAYRGMWHAPGIEVLMQTSFAENDPPVVYIGPHPKARVVYVQLGHSAQTMDEPHYRTLIQNAVYWAARRR
jgi:type 1 glutamine amidotransferase